MNIRTFLKKTLVSACVYFSIITALYSLITLLTHLDEIPVLINAGNVCLFFVFSLLLSFANRVLSLGKLGGGLKLFLHYIICLFAYYSCFMLPISPSASGMLIGLVLFTVIYFIIAGFIALFSSRLKKNTEKSKAYTNQFKKKF